MDEPDFTLHINTSAAAYTEVERLLFDLYPQFFRREFMNRVSLRASEEWEKFKLDAKSILILCRSGYQPLNDEGQRIPDVLPTLLGFLAGGVHPILRTHYVLGMGVVRDERRRGIGTALVRRFLTHTGARSAWAVLRKYPYEQPYEIGMFFSSLQGVVKDRHQNFWKFEIPNKFLIKP